LTPIKPSDWPQSQDKVVQAPAKLVLEPIFEADFEDNAYGYRPARGAVDAVEEVHRHICQGYTDVVDAGRSPQRQRTWPTGEVQFRSLQVAIIKL
jgi:RNA-directed DNA polymerase